MRIQNGIPNYLMQIQKTRTASRAASTFGQQVDIAARSRTDIYTSSSPSSANSGLIHMELSDTLKLLKAWDQWKAQQPPRELPDSYGPTEENIAWLKEHYSGDLSWEERLDALNTAMDMGVITRDQRNDAMGWHLTQEDPHKFAEAEYERYCAYGPQEADWDTCFKGTIASGFKTGDDLFAWMDKILAGETAK